MAHPLIPNACTVNVEIFSDLFLVGLVLDTFLYGGVEMNLTVLKFFKNS